MAATRQKVTNSAGVSEKAQLPDFSDPNFSVYQGNDSGTSIDQPIEHAAGISTPLNERTKEGVSISGGWDPNFTVL